MPSAPQPQVVALRQGLVQILFIPEGTAHRLGYVLWILVYGLLRQHLSPLRAADESQKKDEESQ